MSRVICGHCGSSLTQSVKEFHNRKNWSIPTTVRYGILCRDRHYTNSDGETFYVIKNKADKFYSSPASLSDLKLEKIEPKKEEAKIIPNKPKTILRKRS